MASPSQRLVGKQPPTGRRHRSLLARGVRWARRRYWLLAAVATPIALLLLAALVGSLLLFVREIGATVSACDAVAAKPVAAAAYEADADAPAAGTPPQNFIAAYFAAASQPDAQLGTELGPYVLMAIHEIESSFGRSDAAGVKSGINFANCCKGPFQFYDTAEWSTWKARSSISGKPFGRDGDGDGTVSIYSNHDGMFAAAAYLHHSGAPADWGKAIFSYNHSTAYRDQVLGRAEHFRAHVTPPDGSSPAPASGSRRELEKLAASAGCDTGAAQRVAPSSGGPYQQPLPRGSYTVTTHFWFWRGSYNHAGTDFAAPTGTPIHAIGDGRVAIAGEVSGYGLYTCIDHTQRMRSCYAHQSTLEVEVGQSVTRGQQIGQVGNTGHSTGPHLHFEIRLDGAVQCPANYVGVAPSLWCTPDSPGYRAKPA